MQGNGDALQTLILMNPAYNGYSDNLPPPPSSANFIFLNSSSSANAASQIQHLAGIPLQASPLHQDARFLYSSAAREVTRSKQGLSLSLSSQQPSQPEEVRVSGAPEKAALSCKYLKVAQQLLDEVVNIRKEANNGRESDNGQPKTTAEPPPGDGRAKCGADLTTAEKQEIQMKKAKLVDLLHQVEQRYKQYDEQMQMVIKWLEEAAGVGSAKTYTSLALQTISKQFRCLKDAIMLQIRGATTNLGEMNNHIPHPHPHQINNNNAWRPQRGLPERSVSVLRAWLFQHFLHPYPKDSDKVMLAKQAGLTRSQVSNWFINARVRLWKPMVEEMYAEEMKAQQRDGSEEEDKTPKIEVQNTSPAAQNNTRAKKPRNGDASLSPSMNMSNAEIPMKLDYESRQGFSITGAPANFFASYDPIVGMEQFQQPYSSNGVSLTLGLQHCENLSNQMEAGTHHFGGFDASAMYDNIDVQNNKRFAAQLLPDFVT
ncbi:BEL1-like homeodomain protein 1 isoform X2 [Salvia miltiorrhiza]|nr:BEL1-like homeodomain protein 1 isoform X2 [Salvia miltiorrhiza]XP_057805298.1 BEL1-like homeodomain protein 1 isoform X2 [Salvia miltiorrhiza]XP_057805299.1 BEL1-like homeodomain protein 1 isoform X2 [Salvia miltiorrhiza]XP_057805300.1 BEL1-like homeodomain protein 1 isoform X2 [Salvia miltiorrhiza]XP_057805302.1 BEL1-like homeodomain protein 1 isoform X2 [Salvia miltiorrhiza]XP_057805303.1 BEL1-like homeodomain protein 1 isoform X2 [Salvia miltiorrhiza]XP_057805304.1 BEL1-like homeodomai